MDDSQHKDMDGFDTRRQGYDPKLRPYRVVVYSGFVLMIVWVVLSIPLSIIAHLF